MADYTPEQLESYRKWAESFQTPQSVDELRELQGMAELTARAERGSNLPISSLGESAKGLENLKSHTLPQTSPAEESAKVFEKAGRLASEDAAAKKAVEDIVRLSSRPGKSAAESAMVLEKVADINKPETNSRLAEILKSSTARNAMNGLSAAGKVVAKLPYAAAAYDLTKGDLSNVGADLASLSVNPIMALTQLLRTTDTAADDDFEMRKKVAEWNREQNTLQRKIVSGPSSSPEESKERVEEKIKQPSSKQNISASSPIIKKAAAVSVEQPEKDPLMAAIKSESETPKKEEIDFVSLLEQAKQSRNQQQLLANIGRAGESLSSAVGGMARGGVVTKPTGTDFYKDLAKQAEQGIEDVGTQYLMKVKQEERDRMARRRDANSEESKFARDLLKQQNINVPENATAEALEKYAPQLTNILNQREAREARATSTKERALDRQVALESKLEGKKLDTALRLAPKIQNEQYKTLSEMRSQSALMKESLKNPNPSRDVAIIYGFVKALDPKSAVREGEIDFVQLGRSVPTKMTQYFKRAFTGEILPSEARKEMASYISQREKQAYKEWELSAGPYLKQADKGGIDRELVAPGTEEASTPTAFDEDKKEDPKIKDFASKNSISYDQAENILKARGYGK